MSTSAASTASALGWSYAVTMTIGSPRARFSLSFMSVIGGRETGVSSRRGGVDMSGLLRHGRRLRGVAAFGLDQCVVDESGPAYPRGHRDEHAAVDGVDGLEGIGVDEREVLGLDAVRGHRGQGGLAQPGRVALALADRRLGGAQAARERHGALALAGVEAYVAARER